MSPFAKALILVVAMFALGWGTDSTPASARSAPSPSIRPTKRRCSGSACPPTSTSSSSWWSAAVPTGSPRRASRASAATCSSFRPFRREHRVLFGSAGRQRIPAGRRDGARLLQRLVPRTVLAIEGGLSVRLQYAERATRSRARPPSRAEPGPRRALARRCAAPRAHARPAPRREQPRPHAPHLHERAGHLRLLLGRAAGADRGEAARPLPAAGLTPTSAAAARARSSSATSPPSR